MKIIRIILLIALLAAFIAFPFVFSDPAITTVAVFTLFFAAAASGWNIFSGYSGYIALGHAVYFGIGAYAMALLCQDWNIPAGYAPFFLLPLAGLIAAANTQAHFCGYHDCHFLHNAAYGLQPSQHHPGFGRTQFAYTI